MKHAVSHDLDPQTARRVADKAWQSYEQRFAKYHPRATWTTEQNANIEFTVKGLRLSGTLELQPSAIVLDLDVPFVLRVFKKQAVQVIEDEIRSWIAKAKAGQV